MSTLATTLRTKQKSSGPRGMIAVGLAAVVAIAVTVLIGAQLGTSHPRTAAVMHHSSVGSRALGVSGTPGLGPATASHSALTNASLAHGTSAAGHQPGAVTPVTGDAGVSAASAAGTHSTVLVQATERTSYGAVP